MRGLQAGITEHVLATPVLAGSGLHGIWRQRKQPRETGKERALDLESEYPASHSNSAAHQLCGFGGVISLPQIPSPSSVQWCQKAALATSLSCDG